MWHGVSWRVMVCHDVSWRVMVLEHDEVFVSSCPMSWRAASRRGVKRLVVVEMAIGRVVVSALNERVRNRTGEKGGTGGGVRLVAKRRSRITTGYEGIIGFS